MADAGQRAGAAPSIPAFQSHTDKLALKLSEASTEDLMRMLRCNNKIARENKIRYQGFFGPATLQPAIMRYDGIVFKRLNAASMSAGQLDYANRHLLIGSFLYGLLRPMDLINKYRLEGDACLVDDNLTMSGYWKPLLTPFIIEEAMRDDGILVNLASNEFKGIFRWKQVERQLKVITPAFKVEKEGKLKTVVVYTKICRGAMARWILDNRIAHAADLAGFEYEGFRFERQEGDELLFVLR